MLLKELVETSGRVARLDGRLEKVARLAELVGRADSHRVPLVVAYLSGEPPQGRVGVGPATLREVLPVEPSPEPRLRLTDVDEALDRIAAVEGRGAVSRRKELLRELLARATGSEQEFLVRLLLGELRQGAQEGLVLEAVAESFGAAASRVRRAVMVRGDPGAVARELAERGSDALEEFGIRPFQPVKPMLAQSADDVEEALAQLGEAAFEYKLDGARVQAHLADGRVRIWSRRLNEVTGSLPEVVEALESLPAREAVLDGEVLALREDGRPRPFQVTMGRFGRSRDVERARRQVPLAPFFFDCLYLDGDSLVDEPAAERFAALESLLPSRLLIPRVATTEPGPARAQLTEALEAGHEGLVAKALDAPYVAGRRGASWLKLKPTHTADLVVLAAEWGHGRREGWLSNVHLGARLAEEAVPQGRDPDSPYPPGYAMVGKTFKGMTDEMLEWQTEKLRALELERRGRTVHVRPELVAEVAFDGVQESPTYPAGVALRFARLKGYRPDKAPGEADTLSRLRELAPWLADEGGGGGTAEDPEEG